MLCCFCDLHHADLFYSLQLLFEKRLDAEMYRPIGLEWWQNKYWAVYDHPATAGQFLGLDQAINKPKDVHGNYLEGRDVLNGNYRFEDGIYYVKDPAHHKVQRAITLDKFKEMKFDIMVSSIPQHIPIWNELIAKYQPQAKHVFQVGNAWGQLPGIKNILASTAPFFVPPEINACFYHQEFDLEVYKYQPPINHNIVNSYIHYMKRLDLLDAFRQQLPEFQFTTYGAGMEAVIHGANSMAETIANSAWTWHVKPEGDGYGHVLFAAYACGRPAIIAKQYYQGKLGAQLLADKETCIDISNRSIEESVQLIRKYSQPEEHFAMCEKAYNRFKEVVDFNQEEQNIRKFLNSLR